MDGLVLKGSDATREELRQAWASGDFSAMAHSTVLVGELLCESARLHAGERVLDIATGSGNAALAAARRACETTGIDFVEQLLERARERAAAERLKIEYRYGDAEEIPFADSAFDVALSTFGAMFAPDPERAVSEMFRVVRRGGRVAMTAWRPDGVSGMMFALERKYAPLPRDAADPILWGIESAALKRVAPFASDVKIVKRSVWQRSRSFEAWMSVRLKYFGPLKTVFEGLDELRRGALIDDFREMIASVNQARNGTLLLENHYIEIIAVKG
jgi:SAM-dependent methyltransferase